MTGIPGRGVDFDVAIIGGGPSGSTMGTLLKKYNPDIKVLILEQEVFPRDHIGESQLPGISAILDEMGVWDKVEAANFPIKIGSTNRWGRNPELWDFEFVRSEEFLDSPRPGKYEGIRCGTAFQVDRAIYDKILLDHTAEMGVDVRQGTKVVKIHHKGDRVEGLELASGEIVTANHYVDASGHVGILRRAMGVKTNCPTSLQNVAFWDYWQNAEWAVNIGVGGTKIQVMSLGYGWIWFIPLGPTRTSIGLVVPAAYYKSSGKRPEELYIEAVQSEERIASLIKQATRENKFTTTRDWSFLADRHYGENWYLIGESGGFADPILSAGMTISHAAARELAFVVLEIERGNANVPWLKEQFAARQSRRIWSHIRFADYWYAANAQFADLKEHIQGIAKDAGLDLSPDAAWAWIAQGGFVDDELTFATGAFNLNSIRSMGSVLSELPTKSPFEGINVLKLDLRDAVYSESAEYLQGKVIARQGYIRGNKVLPIDGPTKVVTDILQRTNDLVTFIGMLQQMIANRFSDAHERNDQLVRILEALEAMMYDGWVVLSHNPTRPTMTFNRVDNFIRIHEKDI